MQAENNTSFAVVILAAGSSSRLKKPKQLLQYKDQTLIGHCLQAACESAASLVVVVLGAYEAEIKTELSKSRNPFQVVVNREWQEGMASSIRQGVQLVQQLSPNVAAVILMVCDQPFCTSDLLNNLYAKHKETAKPIITCSYAETFGPPALFHKCIFPELLLLAGDTGAKNILRKHSTEVASIPFPKGKLDIDTLEDYQKLSSGIA